MPYHSRITQEPTAHPLQPGRKQAQHLMPTRCRAPRHIEPPYASVSSAFFCSKRSGERFSLLHIRLRMATALPSRIQEAQSKRQGTLPSDSEPSSWQFCEAARATAADVLVGAQDGRILRAEIFPWQDFQTIPPDGKDSSRVTFQRNWDGAFSN